MHGHMNVKNNFVFVPTVRRLWKPLRLTKQRA